MKERRKTIIEIFDEGTPIDAAARRAVRKAIGKPAKTQSRPKSTTRRSKRRKAA